MKVGVLDGNLESFAEEVLEFQIIDMMGFNSLLQGLVIWC